MRIHPALAPLLALCVSACGAAPGHEETTPSTESLRPLEVTEPSVRLRGVDAMEAIYDMQIVIGNSNSVPVTMRRIAGELFVDGVSIARIDVEGDDEVPPDEEHSFVFDIHMPAAAATMMQGNQYTVRGQLAADAGSGDGSLTTPFEFSGPVPR